jgi:hypothetical protein
MSSLTLTQMNGSKIAQPTVSQSADDWLHSSVRDFFTSLNWEDHPPDVQVATHPAELPTAEALNLGMSVCKFFAAFNWDGAEVAAPVAVQVPLSAPANEFTLDDFSGLF